MTTLITPRLGYAVWSVAEMFTWAGLITVIVARYGFGYDGPLFFVAGLAHGIVFLGYCAGSVIVGMNQRWSPLVGFMAITSAIIPFATLPFDRWLHKKSLLDGSWRMETTDDPRDQTAIDRTFRWFLRHPMIMKLTVLVILGGLLTGLLLAGPPTEWGQS